MKFDLSNKDLILLDKTIQQWVPELDRYNLGNSIVQKNRIIRNEKVLKKLPLAEKNIIDVGCNVGVLTNYIKENLFPKNIIGIDISSLNIYFAKKFFPETSFQNISFENFIKNNNLNSIDYFIFSSYFSIKDINKTYKNIENLFTLIPKSKKKKHLIFIFPEFEHKNSKLYFYTDEDYYKLQLNVLKKFPDCVIPIDKSCFEIIY